MNFFDLFSAVVYAEPDAAADAGAAAETVSAGGGMFQMILMMVIIVAVFYFMLIRPQKKKEKALKDMIAALKVGDEIVTVGGLHGKIVKIKDETFVIESGMGANKSTIKIERSSVSRVTKQKGDEEKYAPPVEEAEEPEEKTAEKAEKKTAEKAEKKTDEKTEK